jgi:hypothetical protein
MRKQQKCVIAIRVNCMSKTFAKRHFGENGLFVGLLKLVGLILLLDLFIWDIERIHFVAFLVM